VRITTKREMTGDGSKWTTQMVVYHAEQCAEEEKVRSKTSLDIFPREMLVSDKGDLIMLGHFNGIGAQSIITVYGPDGKRHGQTNYSEFLDAIPRGPQRNEALQNLVHGKGAAFQYYNTDFLVIPLSAGKIARLSLESGRPAP